MHISGLFIDGFGLYRDLALAELPSGLALFYGDNESGKTTLMEFIRTVLGGPPRRTENPYRPLAGGNHGGRLQLSLADGGTLLVSRHGKKATFTTGEGTPVAGDPATRFFGGLDRQAFQEIFAIGLKDLQGLDVLSREQVRSRLFAAGAGLGAKALPDVLPKIDAEASRLLSATGRGGVLVQMQKELRDLQRRRQELQLQAPEYARATARRQELEEQAGQRQQELAALRSRRRQVEHWEQAREPYARLLQARERAEQHLEARGFPADGLKRWEELTARLAELDEEIRETRARREELEEELRRLPENADILAHELEIEALAGERQKFASALADYPEVQGQVRLAEAEFRRRLGELGPGWDEEGLARMDTSLPVRQEVQKRARDLGAAERHRDEAQTRVKLAVQAVEEAREVLREAEKQLQRLAVPPLEAEVLQEHRQVAAALRTLLTQRELQGERRAARQVAVQDLAARSDALSRQLEVRAHSLSPWLAVLAGLAGAGGAGYLGWEKSYYLAGAAALTGVGLAVLMLMTRRRQRQADRRRAALLHEEREQVKAAMLQAAREMEELTAQEEALNRDMKRLAGDAGLPVPENLREVEELVGRLEQAANVRRRWEEAERGRVAAAVGLRQAERRREQAEQEREEAEAEVHRQQGGWQAWLKAKNLREGVRPENFEEIVRLVEQARAARRGREETRERLDKLKEYLRAVRGRLGTVLAGGGRPFPEAEPGGAELDALGRELAAARESQRRWQELERLRLIAGREEERLEERRRAVEAHRKGLLEQSGVNDEAAFREKAQNYGQWRTWQEAVDRAEADLAILAPRPEVRAALEKELAGLDHLALAAEHEELTARIEDLEAALTQTNQEIGNLSRRLTDLAADAELGRLLFQERALVQKIAAASRRWATLVLTRGLLDQARAIYEDQRQPQVIQEAERFLAIMTRRPYRLVSLADTGEITVEDEARHRRREAAWSAGLADQIYLALRLGLARQFSRQGEPLPVILDDVLVKFDPTRQGGAARLIVEFAREQQVLFFTCHPFTRDLLVRAGREAGAPVPLACYEVQGGQVTPISG